MWCSETFALRLELGNQGSYCTHFGVQHCTPTIPYVKRFSTADNTHRHIDGNRTWTSWSVVRLLITALYSAPWLYVYTLIKIYSTMSVCIWETECVLFCWQWRAEGAPGDSMTLTLIRMVRLTQKNWSRSLEREVLWIWWTSWMVRLVVAIVAAE